MLIYIFNLIIPIYIHAVIEIVNKITFKQVKLLKQSSNEELIKFKGKALMLNKLGLILIFITAYILQVIKIGYIVYWWVEIPIYFLIAFGRKYVTKRRSRIKTIVQ